MRNGDYVRVTNHHELQGKIGRVVPRGLHQFDGEVTIEFADVEGLCYLRPCNLELVQSSSLSSQTNGPAPAVLDFESGATRNCKEHELRYDGFLSPLALQLFAEYMHKNRVTADGSIREPDNWQKGIPDASYVDSLLRHVIDIWMIYRGWESKARDGGDKRAAIAGAMFNVQGLAHNLVLEELAPE
jgi:hypothetical protein